MKKSALITLTLPIAFLGFTIVPEKVSKCLLNYDNFKGLTLSALDRLPDSSPKFRELKTKEGQKRVSRIDGYRVLYNNTNDVEFVNMKVEVCDNETYAQDTITLIQSLEYLLSVSKYMESEELQEFDMNGFRIYGFSRSTIEQGINLGTYVMFPGNNVTVHFYFSNLRSDVRHFKTIEDYHKLRDQFIQKYTQHIADCLE